MKNLEWYADKAPYVVYLLVDCQLSAGPTRCGEGAMPSMRTIDHLNICTPLVQSVYCCIGCVIIKCGYNISLSRSFTSTSTSSVCIRLGFILC